MALVDRLARLDREPAHVAPRRAADLVLHLHGVHDEERLARRDGIPLRHGDADDRALHRGRHRHGAFGRLVRDRRRDLGFGLAEGQHRQGIDSVDPGARLTDAGHGRCRRRSGRFEVEP